MSGSLGPGGFCPEVTSVRGGLIFFSSITTYYRYYVCKINPGI